MPSTLKMQRNERYIITNALVFKRADKQNYYVTHTVPELENL